MAISIATKKLNSSYPTIKQLIENFVAIGILKSYNGKKRNKLFEYVDYLKIIRRGT